MGGEGPLFAYGTTASQGGRPNALISGTCLVCLFFPGSILISLSKCLIWAMNYSVAQLRLPEQSFGTSWFGGGIQVSKPK